MRVKSMSGVGFLLIAVATGVGNVSDSFASDGYRVDVIDALHETVAQKDSGQGQDIWLGRG